MLHAWRRLRREAALQANLPANLFRPASAAAAAVFSPPPLHTHTQEECRHGNDCVITTAGG